MGIATASVNEVIACLKARLVSARCFGENPRMFRSLALLLMSLAAVGAAPRPNLVFILADDLRWDALGFQGNKIVQTPHLDALAARGVRFSNSFVTTSICCTSRASLLCGQYACRHGINDFVTAFTAEQWAETYPARLREAGYRTGFIGKFGVGDEKAIAAMAGQFDYWRGLPGQAGAFINPKDPTRTHATAKFGEQALEFIRTGEASQPFCLSLSFSAPHARDGKPREFEPDARDESLYADIEMPVPAKATERWFQLLPEIGQRSEGRRRWGLRFDTPEKFQRTVRDYFRLVTGLDREVGRITALLAERGLAQNTVIVFTADNGFFFGERGLADKWLMYEESIRVPLFVMDPRAATSAGKVCEAQALNVDVAPTLLDLAGLPASKNMQGRSLSALLRGERPGDWRTDFFYEHHAMHHLLKNPIPVTEGVRTERWKYTRWLTAEPLFEELFDLQADPEEMKNLAAEPAHSAELEKLRARWAELGAALK